MGENFTVDMSTAAMNGEYLVFSLAGLGRDDVKNFATLIRSFITKRKDAVCIPMFADEKSKCPPDIWSAFETLVQRGQFPDLRMNSYSQLLSVLAKTGKKVYVVAKTPQERSYISAANTSGARLIFCELKEGGSLVLLKRNGDNRGTSFAKKNEDKRKTFRRDYQIATVPTIQGVHRLNTSVPVMEGTALCDSLGNVYRLAMKKVRNNGAYTYSTDHPGIWAKIYDDSYTSSYFEDKVRRMLKNPVDVKGIIWPRDVLVDSNGVFRGYILSSYAGEPLQTSVFKRDGQERFFPGWKKEDLCTLTLTILSMIKELHKRGILLGCINPAAIRVVGKNEVYFCDTDNFQIEGYPTLANNISFAAPENLGKKLYLASLDSENFSVAELVFMLLMTGKTPYLSGNVNVIETIRKMNFPFFINDYDERNPSLRVMPSMWRYMWSHLSYELKRAFCGTFQRNFAFNAQGKRLYAYKWYDMVEKYRNEILESNDADDHRLYPDSFKKKEGDTFYRCSICGKEHPKFFFDPKYFDTDRVCNVCMEMESGVSYTCVNCGRTLTYKNRTALYHKHMRAVNDDWHKQRHCPECKAKKEKCISCGKMVPYYELYEGRCNDCRENMVYENRRCTSCGKMFTITYAQKKYYDSKGFQYPKKCEECRKNNSSGGRSGSGNRSSNSRGGLFGRFF